MKKYKFLLIGILLIAFILRFWRLGEVPIAPDWDEVALGYNAYSIMQTGKDEYGELLPVVLRSFDDYKPALYAYLIIPLLKIFGLTVLAVRLPSAIMGVITVGAVYYLIRELFQSKTLSINNKNIPIEVLALAVSFLLAISPWHIQFSRIAFETNVGLGFNILMALMFLKGLRNPKYLSFSVIFAALSIYTYQSEKVFTPLLFLGLTIIHWKKLYSLPKKYIFIALGVGLLVISPMIYVTFTNEEALARARGVSIFSDKNTLLKENVQRLVRDKEKGDIVGQVFNNRRVEYGRTIAANYLSHFDPIWLFIKGDYDVNRHHAPFMGLEYIIFLPFFLIGIYQIIFGKFDKKTKATILFWTLLSPLPASITTGVPHAVRTLNFLPTIQIYIALGLLATYLYVQSLIRLRLIRSGLLFAAMILFVLNYTYYINQYFVQQNYYHTLDWQYGYKELVDYLKPIQGKYKKIIVSNSGEMTQSYMFFLFYLQYDPKTYLEDGGTVSGGFATRKNRIDNIEFRSFRYEDEEEYPMLLIGTPIDFQSQHKTIHTIYYPQGSIAMKIVEKTNED